MRVEDSYRVEGIVIEVLSPRLFRVELANGHKLIGHVSLKRQAELSCVKVGSELVIEMTPFDLSSGSVKAVAKTI